MTKEKHLEAIELTKQIDRITALIIDCNQQKCSRIEFTFGNGSNRAVVCENDLIMQQAKELIAKENALLLKDLQKQFNDL